MSPKEQFIKCVLCVVLYLIVCLFLIKFKKNFYVVQEVNPQTPLSNNQSKRNSVLVPAKVIKKSVNLEIQFLERDVANGKTLNLQENTRILQKIADVCHEHNLKTPATLRHFLYSRQHQSLYCWIRKVASTSFTKLFLDMNNQPTNKDYYRAIDSVTVKSFHELQRINEDQNTFKLLVVRHPFLRLVSSYRDRIEDNSKYSDQAWIYAKKIFHSVKPELFRSTGTNDTFLTKTFTSDKRLKIVPTFREFCEWLLHSPEMDVHWNHYHTQCAVCDINYNYVLKLDDYTFGEVNYIFAKFGLDKTKDYIPRLERTRGGDTDFTTACKYFGSLSRMMIFKLYEKYKIDFEMYNYDLKKYMFCTNKEI